MSTGHMATNELRFVERSEPAPEIGPDIGRVCRVLQQRWASPFVGQKPEWRDVPLVKANAEFSGLGPTESQET